MIRYDAQSLEEQIAVNKAVIDFLKAGDYENLAEACQQLDLSGPEVWGKILSDAKLPPCLPPVTIQVAGPLVPPPPPPV